MGPKGTVFLPPKMKGKKTRYLKHAGQTTARSGRRAQAPVSAVIVNQNANDLVSKVSSFIAHDGLYGQRTTRPIKQRTAQRIAKPFGDSSVRARV